MCCEPDERDELCDVFDTLVEFARDCLENDMFLANSITKCGDKMGVKIEFFKLDNNNTDGIECEI